MFVIGALRHGVWKKHLSPIFRFSLPKATTDFRWLFSEVMGCRVSTWFASELAFLPNLYSPSNKRATLRGWYFGAAKLLISFDKSKILFINLISIAWNLFFWWESVANLTRFLKPYRFDDRKLISFYLGWKRLVYFHDSIFFLKFVNAFLVITNVLLVKIL